MQLDLMFNEFYFKKLNRFMKKHVVKARKLKRTEDQLFKFVLDRYWQFQILSPITVDLRRINRKSQDQEDEELYAEFEREISLGK